MNGFQNQQINKMQKFQSCLLSSSSLVIILLSACLSTSVAESTQEEAQFSAPVMTKYLYEGPDGCDNEHCYCTRETRIEKGKDLEGNEALITVKTLKCEEIAQMRGPAYVAFLIIKMGDRIENLWNGVSEGLRSRSSKLVDHWDKAHENVLTFSQRIRKIVNESVEATKEKLETNDIAGWDFLTSTAQEAIKRTWAMLTAPSTADDTDEEAQPEVNSEEDGFSTLQDEEATSPCCPCSSADH